MLPEPSAQPAAWRPREAIRPSLRLQPAIELVQFDVLADRDDRILDVSDLGNGLFRLRGTLFEQGELPVDFGWYLELEWHRTPQFDGSQLELELKPIIEKDFGRFEIDLNPILEKAVFVGPDKNKGLEFGYAAGIYYNWMRSISPGLEFYGGIGLIDDNDPLAEQQHYIFPVLKGALPGGIEYNFGPGIGLTRGSDRVVTKLNLELEHFIGALF